MATYAVLMSGGVDSSLAAALLKEAGHQVFGLTMRLWACESARQLSGDARLCCSPRDVADAEAVAGKLGIPHYVIGLESEFESAVIRPFCSEYALGRTPNPCILCNSKLKFGAALERARSLGAEFIATGHYAGLLRSPDGETRLVAANSPKDQSYFLFGCPRENMARLAFPLYGFEKTDVRAEAERRGLSVAKKRDSQEICFIADNNVCGFLRRMTPDKFVPGPIVTIDGKKVGEHDGLPGHTIGQRRGLGIALGEPAYVVALRPETNELVVGPESLLFRSELLASDANWLIPQVEFPLRATAKIRFRSPGAMATITQEGERLCVVFDEPQRAITPGQAVVFYRDDQVLGGAWIV
jgi:tRNA-specific 2-thiouridylase